MKHWKEVGLSLNIQFVKRNFNNGEKIKQELGQELKEPTYFSLLLDKVNQKVMSPRELTQALGHQRSSGHINRTLSNLISKRLVEHTLPDNPNNPHQKLKITERGRYFLKLPSDQKNKI